MIGWFVRGAMNLAQSIKYAVQDGWACIVLLKRLLPLTGLRATEFGVDRRILGVVTVVSALVSIASRLVFVAFNFRSVGVACIVFATGQPTVLTCTKVGHECREGCHGFWIFLAEVASEPFVTDAVFEGC